MIRKSFFNPFSLVLLALAALALGVDIFTSSGECVALFTPLVLVLLWAAGGFVRLSYERDARSNFDRHMLNARNRLVWTLRDGLWFPEDPAELVPGDLIRLAPGDLCPVDVRLNEDSEIVVSESSLTGESGTKHVRPLDVVRAGTTVVDGRARALVLCSRDLGAAVSQGASREDTGFSTGAKSICLVYLRFMIVIIPVVLAVRGALLGDWPQALLFSLSSAVGLVPEMLPVVTSVCLSGSARRLERSKVIVKDVDALEALGNIDILCMDKTGTLTEDHAVLEYYTDVCGNEWAMPLDLAFLESVFQGAGGNQLDEAIIAACGAPGLGLVAPSLRTALSPDASDPFDHRAKCSGVRLAGGHATLDRLGVVTADARGTLTILKGDVESVLARCSHADIRGRLIDLDEEGRGRAIAVADEMRVDGIKVLAVAYGVGTEGWDNLIICGFLAFFDVPKQSALDALAALANVGVQPRILTGDSLSVARSVCRRLGVPAESALTGAEVERITDADLPAVVAGVSLFAELAPLQKMRVVNALRAEGHRVGFLGDGVNDLLALQAADLAIVVDTACAEAKDSADIVLLERDLGVVAQGVLEGRRAFANASKYIRIASSSSFGNICSVAVASVFLPFLPATAAQLLVLNLAYDMVCMTLPWDNVNIREINKPRTWSGEGLGGFMMVFGCVSTAFDLITFAVLFFGVCPALCGAPFFALDPVGQTTFVGLFQAGWLLECMWTQSLVILFLRPNGVVRQGCPGALLMGAVSAVIVASVAVLATPAALLLGVVPVPLWYVGIVAVLSALYLGCVSIVKQAYLRRVGVLF